MSSLLLQAAASSQSDVIAKQFGKAASRYRQHNFIQRISAQALEPSNCQGLVLDIGAGPGTEFPHASEVIALDIAMPMLSKLGQQFPHHQRLCANAQQLPLSSQSIDWVYSNLALQWCDNLSACASEIFRVLAPNGQLSVCLVGQGSLPELDKLSLSRNHFLSAEQIESSFSCRPWQSLEIIKQQHTLHFEDLRSLLWSLKGVGASTQALSSSPTDHHRRSTGLKGRAFLQQLTQDANALHTAKGLPLTYQLVLVRAQKGRD